MKKQLIFIVLLFFLKISAQDQRLFDNTWYLNKLVINGDDFISPSNNEVPFIPLLIFESDIQTSVCPEGDSLSGNPLTIDNLSISVEKFFILLGEACSLEQNQTYATLYYNTFFEWQFPDRIFLYEIEEVGVNLKLILENHNGDLAIYGNVQPLSTHTFIHETIFIYPNPVKDVFTINTKEEIDSIIIYDILGREVSLPIQNFTIDTSGLPSGVYLLLIKTDFGTLTQKIIKH